MTSAILQVAKGAILRAYALTVLLVVVWSGYAAVRYLVRTVFCPPQVPAGFLDGQPRLEAQALRAEHVPGVTGPAARAPLGRYHRVEAWFQADPHNGCTTSGCHAPLPHKRSKELSAFANLHSTFMRCELCHVRPSEVPVRAVWVDLKTGRPQEAPAVLQLYRLFEQDAEGILRDPADRHGTILSLLDRALEATRPSTGRPHADPLLGYLRTQIATSEPGSPVWRHSIQQLGAALPNHLRGEYGAKIDVPDIHSRRQRAEQTRRYLVAPAQSPERKAALKDIHAGIVEKPGACLECHGGEPPRIRLDHLGYSPGRIDTLRGTPIARMIQHVGQGQPFYLPRIGGAPGTAPSETTQESNR